MKKQPNLEVSYDLFSAKTVEDVVILSFNENLLFRATDLRTKESLFDYLEFVSKSDVIKVVLIIGSPKKTGREEYIRFYSQVSQSDSLRRALKRLYNAVDQYIFKLLDFNKIVVHADSGKVLSLFMNVSLACDYRIIGDNTVFQNAYLELGLIPKGGGSFLLSRILGYSKTSEILSRECITAGEALRLGIVDKVVPSDELDEAALKIAQEFARKQVRSLAGIKMLLNCYMRNLRDCFECENKLLLGIVNDPYFRKRMVQYTEGHL